MPTTAARTALSLLGRAVRAIEAQVQPVVDVVAPGPLAARLKWDAAARQRAADAVQRALAKGGRMGRDGRAADARAAAVAEVGRLMQHPEHLRRLPELRAEYEAKRASNAARLSAAVASHVDAVRTGSARLDDAARALARLRACYAAIDAACGATCDLVARPDAVASLAAAHAAASDALRGAEAVAALPAEAARAEAMLAGGARLADVHECLAALEGTAAAARRALEGAAAGERAAAVAAAAAAARGAADVARSPPPSPTAAPRTPTVAAPAVDALGPYLDRVRRAGRAFEHRLWATVRGCVRGLGRARPAALVDAARVIEAQEAVDRHLEAAGPGAGAPPPKRWWARACAQVANAVQDAAAPLLASVSRLGVAGTDTDGAVRAILEQAQAFVVELVAVSDYAAPCFARRAAFFDAAARAVADGVAAMAEALAAAAADGHLANADILRVLAWVDAYAATLDELGVGYLAAAGPDAAAARAAAPPYLPTPPGLAAPVRTLVGAYSARAKAALAGWTRTMLATDLGAPPSQAADGLLWTPGAVDFFRSANEQLAAVEESTRGELLYVTASDVLAVMADFQAAQLAAIGGGALDDAHLAALVNNNARAHRESADLAERLADAGCGGGGGGGLCDPTTPALFFAAGFNIEPASRPVLDVEAACRGFLDVAAAATRALAARTLAGDAALGALLGKAACSAEWRAGGLTPSVAATLVDYHGDYAALIESAFAKRLAEALLRGAAAHYAAAALSLVPTKGGGPDASPAPSAASASASAFTGGWWTPADTERLRGDAADLVAAMAPHCRSAEAATRAARPLVDLAGLAGAACADDAALAYSALLQAAPGLVPAMVDRLLAARADWTKAEVKAAGVAAREAFAAARGGASGAGAAAAATTPASSPLRLPAGSSTPGPPPTPAVTTAVKDAAFRAALAALMEGGPSGG